MKNLIISFALFCISIFHIQAQAPYWTKTVTDTTVNYYTMVDSALAYYDSIPFDSAEGSEIARFTRWMDFWESRVDENGSFMAYLRGNAELFAGSGVCNGSGLHDNQWENIGHQTTEEIGQGSRGQGRAECIDYDESSNTIYLGTRRGGLFTTESWTNGQPNWENITDVINAPIYGVTDVKIDPLNSDIIYICSGSSYNLGEETVLGVGLLKTTNGGDSWSSTNTELTRSTTILNKEAVASVIFISPNSGSYSSNSDILYVGKGNELFKTTDGGASFSLTNKVGTTSNTVGTIMQIVCNPNDPDMVFVSTDIGEIWYTTDDGSSWFEVSNTGIPVGTRIFIDVSINTENLFVLYMDPTSLDVNVTNSPTSGTFSFSNVASDFSLSGWGGGVLTIEDFQLSEISDDIMYFGYRSNQIADLVTSTNGGSDFATITANNWHPDLTDLLVLSDVSTLTDEVYVSHDGGLNLATFEYELVNSEYNEIDLETERLNGSGLTITEIYGFDIDNKDNWIVMGCQDLGDYHRYNNTWQTRTFSDGFSTVFNPYVSPNKMFTQLNNRSLTSYSYTNDVLTEHGVNSETTNFNADDELTIDNSGRTYKAVFGEIFVKEPANTDFTTTPIYDFDVPHTRIKGMASYFDGTNETIYAGLTNPSWSSDLSERLVKFTTQSGVWEDLGSGSSLPIQYQGITEIIIEPNNPDHVWVCFGSIYTEYAATAHVKRVFYSSDGGDNWISINKDLEVNTGKPLQHTINDMELDESTGGMYLATDVGVFYNPDPKSATSPWECYNDELPICVVTQLRIDYCNRKILASTLGRGLWSCDLAGTEIQSVTLNNKPDVLDVRLGEIQLIRTNLVIPTGKSMHVKGTVIMAPNTSITVEKGASLVIDGGKITSSCAQWAGVILEGDASKSQTITNQGLVRMLNQGSIENAKNGIYVAGLKADGNVDWNTTGGIIWANNAKFINNSQDITFLEYRYIPSGIKKPNRNISSFSNTEFSVNSEFRGNEQNPGTFIAMWAVNWIHIAGCTFKDDRDVYIEYRKNGIQAIESSFKIGCINYTPLSSCTGTKTNFENLKYAIRSYEGSYFKQAQQPPIIENCVFTDNLGGILLSGVKSANILSNSFNITSYLTQNPSSEIETFGVYLDNCDKYHFENNSFDGDFGVQSIGGDQSIGLVVYQNFENDNQIYRNNFDDIYIGSESIGRNREVSQDKNISGLKLRCNSYGTPIVSPPTSNDNSIDILVVEDFYFIGPPNPNISEGLPQQGTNSKPAGNFFGNYSSGDQWNFHNSTGVNIDYYHHDASIQTRLKPEYIQEVINKKVNLTYASGYCPDKTNPGIVIGTSEVGDAQIIRDARIVKEVLWDQKTDGGNTNDLINDIQGVTQGTLPTLINDLNQYSPYLSISSLLELAKADSPITNTIIRDIMILNPHSSRSIEIHNTLLSRADTFPQSYLSQIDSLQDSLSARDSLHDEIYDLSVDFGSSVNSILTRATQDSIDQFDEIIEPLLLMADHPSYKYLLAEMYDDRGESADAISTLNAIPNQFTLDIDEQRYNTDYINIRASLISWSNDTTKNILSLDSTDIAYLKGYESDSNGIENIVRAILVLNENSGRPIKMYDIPSVGSVPPPNMESDYDEFEITNKSKDTSETPKIIELKNQNIGVEKLFIFPNPSSNQLNIRYKINSSFDEANLVIIDMSGATLQDIKLENRKGIQNLDVSNYPEGQYYCKLVVNHQTYSVRSFNVKR